MDKKVKKIPADFNPTDPNEKTNVGIYCRVSSSSSAQLHSLAMQASMLTRYVAHLSNSYLLKDIYLDVVSGTGAKTRTEYNRMLEDVKQGIIKIIFTKSISRFGRNAEDILVNIKAIKDAGGIIYFQEQQVSSSSPENELYVSLYAAVAESESEAISSNIRWGIKKRIEDGSSAIFDRPCYGYRLNDNKEFDIEESEASTVKKIYALYIDGLSVLRIKAELESEQIPSPSGKSTWSKHTIETILTNKKYCGYSFAYNTYSSSYPKPKRITNKGEHMKAEMAEHHEPIIPEELFNKVQEIRASRSNVEIDENGNVKRKGTRYSYKR